MTRQKAVLLIGATSGVGYEIVKLLRKNNFYVIATCRQEYQKSELEKTGACNQVLLLDLVDNVSIEEAFKKLQSLEITELDAIINCAAKLVGTPLETVEAAEMRGIFQANIYGTVKVIQHAIPMLRQRKGRIVLVGALAGSFVMPLTGIYSASKFALEAISDALRRELYPWEIKTILVKPGAIDTKMFRDHLKNIEMNLANLHGKNASLYGPLYKAHARSIPKALAMAVSTEKLASVVLRALTVKTPKARYYGGIDSKLVGLLAPVLPDRWLDWFARRTFVLE